MHRNSAESSRVWLSKILLVNFATICNSNQNFQWVKIRTQRLVDQTVPRPLTVVSFSRHTIYERFKWSQVQNSWLNLFHETSWKDSILNRAANFAKQFLAISSDTVWMYSEISKLVSKLKSLVKNYSQFRLRWHRLRIKPSNQMEIDGN